MVNWTVFHNFGADVIFIFFSSRRPGEGEMRDIPAKTLQTKEAREMERTPEKYTVGVYCYYCYCLLLL